MDNTAPLRFGALILAAGESSRIGTPKALLTLNHQSFIEIILAQYKAIPLNKIVVVTNSKLETALEKIIKQTNQPIELVVNTIPNSLRIESIKLGCQALKGHAVFLQNVDNPFVATAYLQSMIDSLQPNGYVSLRYQSMGGHPVLLSHKIVDSLAGIGKKKLSLREILLEYPKVSIDTNEKTILTNINTFNDYKALINL